MGPARALYAGKANRGLAPPRGMAPALPTYLKKICARSADTEQEGDREASLRRGDKRLEEGSASYDVKGEAARAIPFRPKALSGLSLRSRK